MNPAELKVVIVIIAIVVSSVGRLRHPVVTATKKAGTAIERVVTYGHHPAKKPSIMVSDAMTVSITPLQISGPPTVIAKLLGTAQSSVNAAIQSWMWTYGDSIWCSGTPTNAPYCPLSATHYYPKLGTYNVSLSVTDVNGATGVATATVVVQVTPPCQDTAKIPGVVSYTLPPAITALTFTNPADVSYAENKWGTVTSIPELGVWLAHGAVGQSYCMWLEAGGGVPPYTFSGTGLPVGLTLAPSGEISGIASKAGTYTMQFKVQDAKGTIATILPRFMEVCDPIAANGTSDKSCTGFGD